MRQLLDQYVQLLDARRRRPGPAISDVLAGHRRKRRGALPDALPAARRHVARLRPGGGAPPRRVDARTRSPSSDASGAVDATGRWPRRWTGWPPGCAPKGVGEGHIVAIYGHRSASLVCAVAGRARQRRRLPPPRSRPTRPAVWPGTCASPGRRRGSPSAPPGAPAPEVRRVLDELGVAARVVIARRRRARRRPARPGDAGRLAGGSAAITDAIGPDSPACLTFTSGSTGDPKAVIGRHGSLTHFLPWQSERVRRHRRPTASRCCRASPTTRSSATCSGRCRAAPPIVVPDPDQIGAPGWLAGWLRRERVTVAHLTPAMGQLVTEAGAGRRRRPSPSTSLRLALFIGDVLTRSDVTSASTPRARTPPSSTSTAPPRPSAPAATTSSTSRSRRSTSAAGVEREVLPLGAGIPGTQLLVRSDDRRAPPAFGEVGEIWFRSPHLALGYLDRPDETAATVRRGVAGPRRPPLPHRRPRPLRADGEVEFLGRRDDQVQLRGFRIELGEIRAALVEPRVGARRRRVSPPGEDGPRPSSPTSCPLPARRRSRRTCAGTCAASCRRTWCRPRSCSISRVPLTPNGKLDRAALPAPAAAAPPEPGAQPRDALEEQLVGWWSRRCSAASVGIHDNFFDLGGYSLLATRLFALIEAGTGRSIPLSALFEAPTIAELAAVIRGGEVVTEWPSLVPIQPSGTQRPFFYVAPYMISVLQFAHLGAELGQDQPLYGLQPQGLDGVLPGPHPHRGDGRRVHPRDPHGAAPRAVPARRPLLGRLGGVRDGPPARGGGGAARRRRARRPGSARRRAADRLPRYLARPHPLLLPGRRLRHALAWQTRIMLNRVRIRRMWNPTLHYVRRCGPSTVSPTASRRASSTATWCSCAATSPSPWRTSIWYLQWSSKTTGRSTRPRADGTHANLLERPYVGARRRLRWAFSLELAIPKPPAVVRPRAEEVHIS